MLTIMLTLFWGVGINCQEWEFVYDSQQDYPYYRKNIDAIELSDGSIVVNTPCNIEIPSHVSTPHPALTKLSADGEEMAIGIYFRPSYCSVSYNQILENKDGDLFTLMTYSPDHDRLSENYFKNFENPPTDAILGLYKLDDNLNIVESYEHYIPIDTTEVFGSDPWAELMPNETFGRLYLFTSFVDNSGDIVGAFFKCPSFITPKQPERDSLFLFKMNFEGEILQMKGVEDLNGYGNYWGHRGHCMIETDSHYILYQRVNVDDYGLPFYASGEAVYFDKDLNLVDKRAINQPGFQMPMSSALQYASVVKSRHNTVYVTSRTSSTENPYHCLYDDTRLYELDYNLDNSTDLLPIVNYITRGTSDTKEYQPLNNGIILKEDNTLIYVHNWNLGDTDGDSWVVIEHLDENFNTISETYYTSGEDNVYIEANAITATKEEDLLLVGNGFKLFNDESSFNFVTKFPASTFLSIEEAHAHGLKAAVAYPNPGGDVMNIRTGLRNAVLSVYDINGRKIHEQEITDDVTSIDASNWQSGTYVWKLGMRNEELGMKEVETGKWIK